MLIPEYFIIKKNQDFLITIIKIIIIGFVSFSLFANAIPFYLGFDDINYGIEIINLSEGNFSITNNLAQENNNPDGGPFYRYFPVSYVPTAQNDAIPKSSVGIYAIGLFFYYVGGLFGLFYFGPIVTTILLIIFERFVTKLFGNLIGLFALLFVVGDWQIFFVGLRFLTDIIFSLFFILGVACIIQFINMKDYRYVLLSSTFFTVCTFIRITGIIFLPIEILIVLGFFVVPYLKKSKIFNKNKNNSESILKREIFSQSNLKNFFKINSFLLIPWIIFLVFWFSFNAYYFDDPGTNYQEQVRDVTTSIEDQEIDSKMQPPENMVRYDFQRFSLVQYYSVPLIPDPLYFFSIITSDTDLEIWRSDIWISYISFSILSIALFISLYFKIKRKETLILLLFIAAIIGIYSSSLASADPLAANLSKHANNRYMIPTSLLSFTLIGFVLVEGWNRLFPEIHARKKILYSIKLTYLSIITIFLLLLIITMPALQDFYQTGFYFNNPFEATKSFEDLEKLPKQSLIVSFIGENTLLHTDTHFYPYSPSFVQKNGDINEIPISKIITLKKIMENGYTAYTYKNKMFSYDEKYFRFLEDNHGIILKDYSKTFCKLELISNVNESVDDISSDPICFNNILDGHKKIWKVTLKWPP